MGSVILFEIPSSRAWCWGIPSKSRRAIWHDGGREHAIGLGRERALVTETRTERGTQLRGRRIVLRPLRPEHFEEWREVRTRCRDWLLKWEPRPAGVPYPIEDRPSFLARCSVRDRERQLGTAYGFGIFVDGSFAGELNLSSVQRGAFQNSHIGYWIDEARAGNGYVPEACVVMFSYAFEELGLHRVQISIVPRNAASRAVMRKLGLRAEGIAVRYLEIDGRWEDHVRYAITAEEWQERAEELKSAWL